MGQPAARFTDMHTCPMVTGVVPHVGGPIMPPCAITVLTGMLPQARVTDMAICVGPPDMIVKGSMTVLVNNLPAARIGDMTAHGGVIVVGLPTVLIGDAGGGGGGGGGGAGAQSGASGSFDIEAQAKAFINLLTEGKYVPRPRDQAKVLLEAAVAGTPFCERCAAGSAAATPAAAPASPVTQALSEAEQAGRQELGSAQAFAEEKARRVKQVVDKMKQEIADNPLRETYEKEVLALKDYGQKELAKGFSEADVAEALNKERGAIEAKYKERLPQELRDYAEEANKKRYGYPRGQSVQQLRSAGKSYKDIIDDAPRPDRDAAEQLEGYKQWLDKQPGMPIL